MDEETSFAQIIYSLITNPLSIKMLPNRNYCTCVCANQSVHAVCTQVRISLGASTTWAADPEMELAWF